MKKEYTFHQFINRNYYLPVIAIVIIALSFLIDKYWSVNSTVNTVQKSIQTYVQNQEKDFERLVTDSTFEKSIAANNYGEFSLNKLINKKYFFYHYTVKDSSLPHLNFWNTQTVLPPAFLLESADNGGFVQLQNGFYVWQKIMQPSGISIALIPVKWNYFVTNDYLKNSFAIGQSIENNYDIALRPTNAVVKSIDGSNLFYLQKKSEIVVSKNNLVVVLLRVLAALFILMFVHLCANFIAYNYRLWMAVLFLISVILIIRVASYIYPIPVNFRQLELFDPSVYGSNVVLRSLGDLLINSILFTWIVLFIRHQCREKNIVLPIMNSAVKGLVLSVITLSFLTATFTCAHIIRTLVADSQISFDVINFFTLTIYSVTGFVVLCCMIVGYFVLCQIFFYLIKQLYPQNIAAFFLALAVGGLVYLTFRLSSSNAGFEIFVLLWLVLFVLLLNSRSVGLLETQISSLRLVFWLFFFSLSITSVVVRENKIKEKSNRMHYAETLAAKADPSSENMMNTMLTDYRNEFLAANFNRFKTDSESRVLKDSLVNNNFAVYTNKYETKIYSFDSDEKPLFNQDAISYNEFSTVMNAQARPTGIPDLYYYDESYDRFSFICRKIIKDESDSLLGYIFILANPKQSRPEALYPELFSKGHNNSIENSPVYSFAVYNQLQLVSSHNDYPFATRLNLQQVPQDNFTFYNRNGYDELWYKVGPKKVVIIAKKDNLLMESVTLFSWLFCSFLLVTLLFWLFNIFLPSKLNRQRIKKYWQPSIRSQIHGTIIFVSVMSFLVIAAATILFFISRYENNNREKLSVAIHIMENEVRTSLSDLPSTEDVITMYEKGYREKLEKIIAKIAEIHADDVNLYDLDGNLQVSSLSLPYQKGIVSNKMNPIAYYHLNHMKEVQFYQDEKIGSLNYVSMYVPVIDKTGREYAYINIPYFTSESKLKDEIANFLVTIINLNAFIFLIAGIIALFITNRITRSFALISNKMKAMNLGRVNEAIEWKRDDEIGELVKEYNKMVSKLDDSALALAKSEREGAWREMARQVAHEIKNPLTPMKLSLQYLQKAISSNSNNIKELTANVAQTLVEQIEHLNQIAGEFSQFANIGNPHAEIFELHELLKSLVQLYHLEENVQLQWNPLQQGIFLNADRTHTNRLFTNLIQNAIQSVPVGTMSKIEIEEKLINDKILVSLTDNGMGIEENLQSKIFTPNFTTKTSGTGLGLAMCKGIVEQAGGKIWFETKIAEGTTFFVELPVFNGNLEKH